MSASSISSQTPGSEGKNLWEDPCITLERDLEVRAQGGPGDLSSPQGVLGPFNQSGDECLATPTPSR